MAIFGPKRWVNPFGKMSIFDFLSSMFLQPRKAIYRCIISYKTFSWSILPKKKKWKNGIFGPKSWVNPFGKMSIFRRFELLVSIAQKSVFSLQNIIKDIFMVYIAPPPKVLKMAIFRPKPCVNPFRNMSIFDFLIFMFLQHKKGIFRCRIS